MNITGAIPILRLMSHFAECHGSNMTATNIEVMHLEAADAGHDLSDNTEINSCLQ